MQEASVGAVRESSASGSASCPSQQQAPPPLFLPGISVCGCRSEFTFVSPSTLIGPPTHSRIVSLQFTLVLTPVLCMCCCGPDEEGVTVTLDRFDPGRDQPGASGRVPSALLPGDVLVPCLFSIQNETSSDAVVQSEAELHHCFKVSLTPAARRSASVCLSV